MPNVKRLLEHKILLDTHVWLGLISGNPILSPTFAKEAQHAADFGRILVAPISIWEIGMLVEKKRINLDRDPLDWIEITLEQFGLKLASLTPKIAIESTRLPELAHADPADRLLIATAREENAVFVTYDEKILAYGKGHFLSTYDPRA